MGRSISHSASSSSSSSIDSNISKKKNHDLSTDLKLGLSFSRNDLSSIITSSQREQSIDWPPVKHRLRSSQAAGRRPKEETLFVKVYMEGVPIGRKLDLISLDGYNGLITTLCHMFNTTILCCENEADSDKYHVVTYEDGEGDWMMVGDVPWEMFLTSVRRLKITRADRC